MANPSPDAIAAIAVAATWTQTNNQVLAALNAPSVANPAPQATIAKPFGFADVFACLSEASVANVRGLATGTDLIDKINAMDRVGLGHWVAALSAAPALITPAEASAVIAVLAATEPDPSFPSQISWAVANLGRPVDLDDIIAARPGAN